MFFLPSLLSHGARLDGSKLTSTHKFRDCKALEVFPKQKMLLRTRKKHHQTEFANCWPVMLSQHLRVLESPESHGTEKLVWFSRPNLIPTIAKCDGVKDCGFRSASMQLLIAGEKSLRYASLNLGAYPERFKCRQGEKGTIRLEKVE